VGEIERDYDVSVVLLRRNGASDPHPAATRAAAEGDTLAVLGEAEPIARVVVASR